MNDNEGVSNLSLEEKYEAERSERIALQNQVEALKKVLKKILELAAE